MAAAKKRGPIICLLSLMALLGLAMLAIPFLLTPPAYLYLQLSDTVFKDSAFKGKKIEVINNETGESHSFKIYKFAGDYMARVGRIESGKSNWQAKVEGYYPADFSVDIPPMRKETVPVSLKPDFGRLKILPKNVVEPEYPINTELKLTLNGKKVTRISNKDIIVSHLIPGRYTINAEARGFYPSKGEEASVSEGKTTEAEVHLIPLLKDNEAARIVLRWDKDPRDLDSHLFLPENEALNIRHIYYPSKYMKARIGDTLAAVLDVDDTTSYGPETVTIYKKLNGLYRYAVYHYAGSGSIGGTSKAGIKVITHNNGIQEFPVPIGCKNRWWYVLDLKVNDLDVQVIHKNQCPTKMGWRTGKKEEN
jgi:hypothetical protein